MKEQMDRRKFLALSSAGAMGLAAGMLPRLASAKDKLTIGIVYVGARDDFGWNQSHAVAADALRSLRIGIGDRHEGAHTGASF